MQHVQQEGNAPCKHIVTAACRKACAQRPRPEEWDAVVHKQHVATSQMIAERDRCVSVRACVCMCVPVCVFVFVYVKLYVASACPRAPSNRFVPVLYLSAAACHGCTCQVWQSSGGGVGVKAYQEGWPVGILSVAASLLPQ